MIGQVIQISIISLIFIMVVHNILYYFINLLTLPKEKEDFKFIFEPNTKDHIIIGEPILNKEEDNSTDIHNLPTMDYSTSMKEELKQFLQSQLDTTLQGNTNFPTELINK